MRQEAIDAAAAGIGSKAMYGGAAASWLGWFLSNEFFGLVGVLVAVIGLYVNIHFKHKANERAEREHKLRMTRLKRGLGGETDLGKLDSDE